MKKEKEERWQTIDVGGVLVRCKWGDAKWVRMAFADSDESGLIQDGSFYFDDPREHGIVTLDNVLYSRGAYIAGGRFDPEEMKYNTRRNDYDTRRDDYDV